MEVKLPFGKKNKSFFENSLCFAISCCDVIKSRIAQKPSSLEKRFNKYKDRLIQTLAQPNDPPNWRSEIVKGLIEQEHLKYIILNFTVLDPNSRMQVVQIVEELMNKDKSSQNMNPLSENIFYNKGEIMAHLLDL